jgi:hypothetical protein
MASNDLPSREDLQAAGGKLTEMATEEQPLVLNPEDVKVDDTLPPYYGNTKVNGLVDYASGVKPPTNEEISKAIESRKVARKKVNDIFKKLMDTETSVKTDIKNKWENSKPYVQKSLQETLNTFKLQEYKELINFLKAELVWWDNNKKLTLVDVNTRDVSFDEKFDTLKSTYLKAVDSLNKDAIAEKQKKIDEERELNDKIMNATTADIAWDATTSVFRAIVIIVYIIFSIFIGSLVANDYIHKTIPYKLLGFIYGTIFAPIVSIYYIIKIILSWFGRGAPPLLASVLPIMKYENYQGWLLGFDNRYDLIIQNKINDSLIQKENYIKRNLLAELQLERAEQGA